MQTRRTNLTGVARVDLNDGDTNSLSLVENHALELVEAPRVMQTPLRTTEPLICSVTNTRQVLKSNSGFRLFRFLYNAFRYCVVDVFDCSRFFSRKPFQDSPSVLPGRTLAFGSLRLQRLANLVSFNSIGIESLTAENFSSGSGGDILHAQINTKHSFGFGWLRRIFFNLNVKKIAIMLLAQFCRRWFLVSKRI